MATLILQTVGTAVGGFLFGPLGAVAGRALGALGGSVVDQSLFGAKDQIIEGPKLDNVQFLSSREGAVIPRVFGRSRISGEVIWATRLIEVQKSQKQSQGGKGASGPKTTVKTYSYYANFAVGLCEGPIAGIRRIWADGKELDQSDFNIRTHRGTEDQLPDALIDLKQDGDAPAYRGLAYVVFEDFPLEEFGNRIPQISIEVLKPIGEIENRIYGVNLIPGATEFGYDPSAVVEKVSKVEYRKLNTHQSLADTDFLASLDELLMLCPNLKQVALVVAWFGDDLRAEHCKIRPKVEVKKRNIHRGDSWTVAGIRRSQAQRVSLNEGVISYGGSPSDQSVVRAIRELKARGLKVCLNPFIMMDIAADNTLPDPYGGDQQAAYPWRGRITCFPASGYTGTSDQTEVAGQQIEAFLGDVELSDVDLSHSISSVANTIEWSYRYMIFHYTRLAEEAGGVDMFLIGSEMVGLTRVRGTDNSFPFVDGLMSIASDVKATLGSNCTVTYSADWSEYFGYHPQDGSGDLFFNLDPLWSHPAIGVVAIDNYMPTSDWRDSALDNENGYSSTDVKMLENQISAGEGFDWHYASQSDRQNKAQTPITDGLEKPWVFKFKDLKSWWFNSHYNRVAGVEVPAATNWKPQSKPIIFAEFGAPAIHNGPAQPNVFYDAKSSERAVPYFSNGGRDDGAMLSYIQAQQLHWDESSISFSNGQNPQSSVYAGRMVDFQKSQLWAWDARPFPQFPQNIDVWSDGENWQRGHWLNGRLGSVRISDLLNALLHQIGILNADTSQVDGVIDGYVIASSSPLRSEIEALMELYQISVSEQQGKMTFRSKGAFDVVELSEMLFVADSSNATVSKTLVPRTELVDRASLSYIDPVAEFQPAQLQVEKVNVQNQRQASLSLPIVSDGFILQSVLDDWLNATWAARKSIAFSLPLSKRYLEVGTYIQLENAESNQVWQITSIEEGTYLTIEAKAIELGNATPVEVPKRIEQISPPISDPTPLAVFLDLPVIELISETISNLVAVSAKPWIGSAALYSSPTTDDYNLRQIVEQQASIGELTGGLVPSSSTSRWSWAEKIRVKLYTGQLFSANSIQVLSGGNAIAVRSANNQWEIVQFLNANLVGDGEWELSGLLRGQSGTEQEARLGSIPGAEIVLLNDAVEPIVGSESQKGQVLNWAIGRSDKSIGNASIVKQTEALGQRGNVPFSPVHLKARQNSNGAVFVSWKRRNRLRADSWEQIDIPLSEAQEKYTVHLRDELNNEHELGVEASIVTITSAQLQDWFSHIPKALDIQVGQVSAVVGPGQFTKTSIQLNH